MRWRRMRERIKRWIAEQLDPTLRELDARQGKLD
jgi:hypothetical protein